MLENGVQLTVRNDASFLLDGYLSLYEHQSSPNFNMPLRGLLYIVKLLEPYVENKALLKRNRVYIPNPQFVVLYNGNETQPEIQTLKLSDSYLNKDIPSSLELTCVVYNINGHYNPKLTENCDAIQGYMAFVDKVRSLYKGLNKEQIKAAVKEAIEYCIENSILPEFFRKNRELIEENEMLDLTFDRQLELATKDAKEEGIAEKALQVYQNCIARGMSKDVAVEISGIKEADIPASTCATRPKVK